MCTTLFKNARLILPTGIFLGELLVRDDKIEAVSINHALPHFEAQHTVDVNGKYLSPGFTIKQNHHMVLYHLRHSSSPISDMFHGFIFHLLTFLQKR